MNFIDIAAGPRLRLLNPTGCPLGIEPRLWRKALSRRIEAHLALANALLTLVDGLDGDADCEASFGFDAPEGGDVQDEPHDPGDDNEPSLGWRPMHEFSSQASISTEHTFDPDREDEFDGREPEADLEPSLGAPEIGECSSFGIHNGAVLVFPASQELWANGDGLDGEAVDEDGDATGTAE